MSIDDKVLRPKDIEVIRQGRMQKIEEFVMTFPNPLLLGMRSIEQERAFLAVLEERYAQDEKWGDQSHHTPEDWLMILTEEIGEWCRARMEHRYRGEDPANIRTELVQVAAVAMAMLEYMPAIKSEQEIPEGCGSRHNGHICEREKGHPGRCTVFVEGWKDPNNGQPYIYWDSPTCSRCGGKPGEPSLCPFDQDIKGEETMCNCCDKCRDDCAEEI